METGHIFELRKQATLCDGRLTARRFVVELTNEAVVALGFKLARAYVVPHRYGADPNAVVAPRLPTVDRIRKGDFGEFLTHLLYTKIFDHEIPFSRLWAKPAPNATQQGPDTVSVIVKPGESPQPFTAESKVRTGSINAGRLLAEIYNASTISGDKISLAAAWNSGLDKLDAHPTASRAYAYAAAHHLALLDGTPSDELPPYECHAVIITDGADIKGSTIESHWGDPPVEALSIVIVPGLTNIINRVYDEANRYTAGQLLGTMSGHPIEIGDDPEPFQDGGLLTPIDPVDLASWRTTVGTQPSPVAEAALWYLADHDGIARARALTAIAHFDATTAALSQLLAGKDRIACQTAKNKSLSIEKLLEVISNILTNPGPIYQDQMRITIARDEVVNSTENPASRLAISLTVEAIYYRLTRQPQRFLATNGITGQRVRHVGMKLYESGIHAFWPSQVRSIEAGLLSNPPQSFVMRLPTSGGKTALIALAAANVLDDTPDGRVVILAPTRALVSQLCEDLRGLLSEVGVGVFALHGELELSDELPPGSSGLITIMTTERFDLDWRRSTTIEDLIPIGNNISTVIVDEAHYLADDQRGARLELALSRVLRFETPIILASSQLSDLPSLAKWIDGDYSETDWQPAHHIRQVYYRDQPAILNSNVRGCLIDETNIVEERLTIVPKLEKLDTTLASRLVRDQGAALATQFCQDGPVVLFSAIKRHVSKLADNLYERVKDDPPHNIESLVKLTDQLPISANRDRQLLLAGIGVHHRDISQYMRKIVEQLARRGDLRYLVCTSTLIEGIDFPTRTILMIYPQHGPISPSIEFIRNLEGRTGRGGIYTSGRLVLFAKDFSAAKLRLQLFKSRLRPTSSQLASVFDYLVHRADDAALYSLEPFLLSAIAEAAVTDADLRNTLEAILGRSLFFAALSDIKKGLFLQAVEIRANKIKSNYSSLWAITVYRTGLPLSTCAIIYERLKNVDLALFLELSNRVLVNSADSRINRAIRIFLEDVIIEAPEFRWPSGIDKRLVGEITERWLSGIKSDEVAEDLSVSETDILRSFDVISSLGSWLIGAAIEIMGYLHNLHYKDRVRLHRNLKLKRVRFGTNSLEAAELVTTGVDRSEASRLWDTYCQSRSVMPFSEWVNDDPL